jgi:hypothetical protein
MKCVGLARVSFATVDAFAGGVVEFDCSDDARVRPQYYEVDGELTDPVEDTLRPSTPLERQRLYDLHLSKHDLTGQCLSQTLKQLSFALRQ